MNTVYDEKEYFEKLKELRIVLMNAAKAYAVCDYLDKCGVPKGSVIYSSPVKKYKTASGKKILYQYTNAFLYINRKKYYVSKSFPYNYTFDDLSIYCDPENKGNLLILQYWLLIRMDAVKEWKRHIKDARGICNFLNSIKPHNLPRIHLAREKEAALTDFFDSEEYLRLTDYIGEKMRRTGSDLPSVSEQNDSVEIDLFLCTRSDADCVCPEKKPDLNVENVERKHNIWNSRSFWFKRENDHRKYMDFDDADIFNERDEMLRSKNEVIAARCAGDCGICYEIEPTYPGTMYRADFKLHVKGEDVWVEIAGMRNDPLYESRLQEKRQLAEELGLRLVIIDMTAYPDAYGREHTRFRYKALCRIFQYIQLGLLRKGIVYPY